MLFLVLSAIAGAITLVSGGITILDAIRTHPGTKPQQLRFRLGLTLITLLLTLGFLFASFQSSPGNSLGSNPTPTISNPQPTFTVGTAPTTPPTVPPSPRPSAAVPLCNPPPPGEGTGTIDLTGQTTTHTFTGTGGEDTLPTFTGTGSMDTPSFQVGTNWSLDVSCTSLPPVEPGQFIINVVDNSDGAIIESIYVETCTSLGDYEERAPEAQGGTFYLQINAKANISWEIQIRVCANQPTC